MGSRDLFVLPSSGYCYYILVYIYILYSSLLKFFIPKCIAISVYEEINRTISSLYSKKVTPQNTSTTPLFYTHISVGYHRFLAIVNIYIISSWQERRRAAAKHMHSLSVCPNSIYLSSCLYIYIYLYTVNIAAQLYTLHSMYILSIYTANITKNTNNPTTFNHKQTLDPQICSQRYSHPQTTSYTHTTRKTNSSISYYRMRSVFACVCVVLLSCSRLFTEETVCVPAVWQGVVLQGLPEATYRRQARRAPGGVSVHHLRARLLFAQLADDAHLYVPQVAARRARHQGHKVLLGGICWWWWWWWAPRANREGVVVDGWLVIGLVGRAEILGACNSTGSCGHCASFVEAAKTVRFAHTNCSIKVSKCPAFYTFPTNQLYLLYILISYLSTLLPPHYYRNHLLYSTTTTTTSTTSMYTTTATKSYLNNQ